MLLVVLQVFKNDFAILDEAALEDLIFLGFQRLDLTQVALVGLGLH